MVRQRNVSHNLLLDLLFWHLPTVEDDSAIFAFAFSFFQTIVHKLPILLREVLGEIPDLELPLILGFPAVDLVDDYRGSHEGHDTSKGFKGFYLWNTYDAEKLYFSFMWLTIWFTGRSWA